MCLFSLMVFTTNGIADDSHLRLPANTDISSIIGCDGAYSISNCIYDYKYDGTAYATEATTCIYIPRNQKVKIVCKESPDEPVDVFFPLEKEYTMPGKVKESLDTIFTILIRKRIITVKEFDETFKELYK